MKTRKYPVAKVNGERIKISEEPAEVINGLWMSAYWEDDELMLFIDGRDRKFKLGDQVGSQWEAVEAELA